MQRLRRLVRRSALREAEGCIVVEGAKLIAEALSAGVEVESVFLAPDITDATDTTVSSLIAELQRRGIRCHELEVGVLERVVDTVTAQPIVAIVRWTVPPLSALSTQLSAISTDATEQLVVVLVDVRDPGNAGTVLRSAEAAGVNAVVTCNGTVDIGNPKTVRASAGALFHVPVVAGGTVAQALAAIQAQGICCIGTTIAGAASYDEIDLTQRVALVFGNEANGLSADVVAMLDDMVTIPIHGRSESLNVSMAASVLCFEAARQRRRAGSV